MTTDCQAKPPCNPDGTLRSIKDRTDLAAVQAVYQERAVAVVRGKLAEYRAATPNAGHLLSFNRGTYESMRAMLAELEARVMTMDHLAQVQRRDMETTIVALADRVADLEQRF